MPEQLRFDLPVRAATGREAFFVSPSNALAVAEIDRWASWPAGTQIFVPSSRQPSPSARAWVSGRAGSAWASFNAAVRMVVPSTTPGSNAAFCSSLPNSASGRAPSCCSVQDR